MAPKQDEPSSISMHYGSINVQNADDNDEYAPLVVPSTPPDSSIEKHKKRWDSPKILAAAAAAALFLVVLMTFRVTRHQHQHVEDSGDEQEKRGSGPKMFSSAAVSPVSMGLQSTERRQDASPSPIWGNVTRPLPTNSWYLNLVSHRAAYQPDDSTSVYTIPYIIDTAAAAAATGMSGIRVHWPVLQASTNNMQMVDDYKNSISLGTVDESMISSSSPPYTVLEPLSPLGVSLQWGDSATSNSGKDSKKSMTSHIVRGMPYATMQYHSGVLPVLYSYNGLDATTAGEGLQIDDGESKLKCGVGEAGKAATIENEIQMHFINSDFTWIVFFSQPVKVTCEMSKGDEKLRDFRLNVVSFEEKEAEPLTVRLALLDQCTTGKSNIQQHCDEKSEWRDRKEYEQRLRDGANAFPSSPQIDFDFLDRPSESDDAQMIIDWGALTTTKTGISDKGELLMFALPHHQDSLDSNLVTKQCINTFHGSTCLVRGESWKLSESVGRKMSFTASRPPEPSAIPDLADALLDDIHYRLSSNLLRGAADTYFSGKLLARLGRVIEIASEMKLLATSSFDEMKSLYDDIDDDEALSESMEAAASVDLPSDGDISTALEQLKEGVAIWLDTKAEAPFIYDKSWGGLVNCGCRYVGKGEHGVCNNTFPDCPALKDVNEDFGNGYYNDHHYHLGYHMYAAAVAAKFDPFWGMEHFDSVLLYVRDFANPSDKDAYFTQFRQKDWFLGSSWASGIVSAENSPHGRNEESSSEAISAYEAVALYGSVMVDAFSVNGDADNLAVAKLVRDAGQFLTATEIHATNRYWHVWSSDTHASTYPAAYKQPVVGMLYDTMASFQTWFSSQPVVSYGIQLLPLTPVAEARDDPEWAAQLYPLYKKSCHEAGDFCVDNGWSILQAGLLATTGDRISALEQALAVPSKVFDSQGGLGNSLSNTIWYISTRKPVNVGM